MLRPLTTGELLDRTFALYRKNFLLFVTIVTLPSLAALAIEMIAPMIALARPEFLRQNPFIAPLMTVSSALVGGVVGAIGLGIAQGATVFGVAARYMGKPITAADCYRQIKGKIGRLIGITFGTSILIGLATMLLIIPGILLAVRWTMVVPVAMLEDAGFSVATSRSSDLSDGKRWQIFLIGLLYFVMTYAVMTVMYLPIIIIGTVLTVTTHSTAPPAWIAAVAPICTFFGKVLVAPFATIAFSMVYYDARVRKEALDLELLMESVGTAGAAQSAAAGMANA
jgi:hypothetical protein